MCTVAVNFFSPSVNHFLLFFLNISNLMSERSKGVDMKTSSWKTVLFP